MYTFPVSPIRPAAAVRRKVKTKAASTAEAAADSESHKVGKVQARAPRNSRQAAPKSAAALSSPGVQAALMFLKSGG